MARRAREKERTYLSKGKIGPVSLNKSSMNLEEKGEERIVKISAKLEEDFKQHLVGLLKEKEDVFAWSYSDMEGINPKFYQHKINLKERVIPIK